MKHKECGTTLIELLSALSIFAVIVLGLMSVLAMQGTVLVSMFRNQSDNSDIEVAGYRLSSTLAAMNVKIFGFIGDGSGQAAIIRLPLVDRCSDLSTGCSGNSAFLFASINKRAVPLHAVCILNEASQLSLIVDITPSAGMAYQIAGSTINLVESGNVVSSSRLPVGGFVSTHSEQYGVLLQITDAPAAYDPQWNASTGRYNQAAFDQNPDCLQNTRSTSLLAKIEVQSFVIPYSGPTVPTRAVTVREIGRMPLRVSEAKLTVIGKDAAESSVNLSECVATSGTPGAALNCSNRVDRMVGIEQIDFHSFLNTRFMETDQIISYGHIAANCEPTEGCLMVPYSLPFQYKLPTERLTRLSNVQFTLLKQEYLSTLLIQLHTVRRHNNGQEKRGKKTVHVNLI